MSTENDRLLELIGKGDTLQALHLLVNAGSSEGARLAVNRALYGAAGNGSGDTIDSAREQSQSGLNALNERDKATALFNLGCFSLHQDDVQEARIRFAEVLELEPQHIMARHNLAYAQELLAETADARREYQAVLAQNPDMVLTRLNLAQLQLQEGDVEGGVAELEALNDADPANMGVLLYLCRGLVQRGSEADMRTVLERLAASSDAGRYVDLQECRAYALFQLGETDAAEAAFRELLEASADNLFAITGMIKVLGQRGDYEGMKAYVGQRQALDPAEAVGALQADLAGL